MMASGVFFWWCDCCCWFGWEVERGKRKLWGMSVSLWATVTADYTLQKVSPFWRRIVVPRTLKSAHSCQFIDSRALNSNCEDKKQSDSYFCSDILTQKHENRILRHCWHVLKVGTVFLSDLWVSPLLLFSAQILAWRWETRSVKFVSIPVMSENPTLVL